MTMLMMPVLPTSPSQSPRPRPRPLSIEKEVAAFRVHKFKRSLCQSLIYSISVAFANGIDY